MNTLWSDKARSLKPYTAGEQPKEKMIKLNTNENAYPPSPKVAQAIMQATADLRLYPSPDSDALREEIAKHHGVSPSQVFCSNGSDEALALCFAAFFQNIPRDEDKTNWFPGAAAPFKLRTLDVTYSFYPVWADLFDIPLDIVPLKDDFSVDVPKMHGARGVVLPNPNAPTGVALPLSDIESIAQKTEGVFVVDEAYGAFGAKSAIPLISRYRNIAVVRTLSKSHALAGLRVGYVVADEELIGALNIVKNSFNSYPLDRLAQAGAIAALRDTEYYDQTIREIIHTRTDIIGALYAMGVKCLPSHANFLFVKMDSVPAVEVFQRLRDKGVLVRYFGGKRTKDYLRVTIGTPDEMRAFLTALKEII